MREHHIITWSLHGKWNAIKETADFVISGLEKLGIPCTVGKTWTTDAIYRGDSEMIEQRRKGRLHNG